MSQDRSDGRGTVSRRKWLKVTSTGLVGTALAGCSGDGSNSATDTDGTPTDGTNANSDTATSTTESGEPIDPVYTMPGSTDITRDNLGFNDFNSESNSIRIRGALFENFMGIDSETGEFQPRIIESVDISGKTMTATISGDYGWSNGEPITAKDVETQVTLWLGHDYSVSDLVESVTAVDDQTAEFKLTSQANPEILKQRTFLRELTTSNQVYGKYAKQFKDASSEEEKKAAQKSIQQFSVNFDANVDKLITSGAMKFDDVNNKRVMLVPNENHPHADAINFEGQEFLWIKDASSSMSLLKSDRLDHLGADLSRSYLDSLPDHHEYHNIEEFGGNSIDFYLQDDLYGDVRVRKAFNYLVSQEKMTKASDFVATPVKYMAGTPDFLAEQYIPQETLDKFQTYDRDPEKAGELLREAGFTKKSGTWHKPDGEPWAPSIGVAAGSSGRIKELRVATNQLQNAGVQAEMNITEAATYWKQIRQRDYSVGTYAWGDRGFRHPYFDYSYMYIGRTFNDQDEAWNGLTDEVEVPGTIGDPNSSKETWNLQEMTTELGQTNDEDQQQELITKLAWMYNQHVVKLPINHTSTAHVLTRDHWKFPSKETLDAQRDSAGSLFQKGQIQAKTE